MSLFDMKQQRKHAYDKIDTILQLADNAKREPTATEQADVDMCMTTIRALNPQIAHIESKNTMGAIFNKFGGLALMGETRRDGGGEFHNLSLQAPQRVLSADYPSAFFHHLASRGTVVESALYEGSDGAGGYAVPVVVSDQIVPLAPQEMAIRRLATVIPTSSDIRVPQQLTFGGVAVKSESGASANSFTESDPTLGQFTLSAFLAGGAATMSWELAQDVPTFQSFATQDLVLAQQMFEENWYVNGTGTGQAQGLIGNVGAGVTEEPDANGNLVSISGILDLIASLKSVYHPNASFLMTRATSVIIRKAQVQANLFEPAWTRVGAQDCLFGYPVFFSSSMPTAARSACPVLFGDFKLGYVIGDRGGAGINVKVLDQPLATQGQIQLLVYHRTDGRVRRSEAIQSYNIAAS